MRKERGGSLPFGPFSMASFLFEVLKEVLGVVLEHPFRGLHLEARWVIQSIRWIIVSNVTAFEWCLRLGLG